MLRWEELVALSERQLAYCDLAETNLACAVGLPDAKELDITGCLVRLQECTNYVHIFTKKMLPAFWRRPKEFNCSQGYFRILCMITALQRDQGIRYNPGKIAEETLLDTADIFIHGALLGNGGTCASLPVVYVAVGRKLGYPLRLVSARAGNVGHLFVRWDDPGGERFNIEATNQGLSCYPDEHYQTGVYAVDSVLQHEACLLKSMTPKEELAGFLAERGFRWLDFGSLSGAASSFAWAAESAPHNVCYASTLAALNAEIRRRAIKVEACYSPRER